MRLQRDNIVSKAVFYDIFQSPLGYLYLIFSGKVLSGVSFQKPSDIPFKKGHAPKIFLKQLSVYFQGGNKEFSQEVVFLAGTEFEKKVWSVLKKIPFGETRTYKWVAEKIGKPAAARAVGQALSKNPIPIVIPCHRVIESDGSLGGYSSGVEVKKRLLEMEYYASMDEQI
ncbi:MAG: methylated-DNA--[protein]-cysteine S-methyltransferase [Nitrospiraceae bacterium]|nr:MAG: methylated-DNA--[protein]-cysteine S-methyltransferase [Nitrospiraceae bacterium]